MKRLALLTASIAAISSLSFAQVSTTPATPAAGMAVQPGGAATTAVAPEDAQFMKNAAVGGMFEVMSSQMATTSSQSAEVKQFAQKMIQDHTAANQQLKQLAASKNIPVPAALDDKHQKMIDRLQKAQGQQFDNAYGRQQLRAHKEAVALFEKAAADSKDPEIKAFASSALPILKQHMEHAQSLPGASGGDKAEKKSQEGQSEN